MVVPTFSPSDKYVLANRESGTALTLADMDGMPALTVKDLQYGDNQMWQFVKTAQGYAIQCFQRPRDGRPIYVGVSGRISLHAPIMACAAPLSWTVILYQDRGLYISWPESEFDMELAWTNGQCTDKIALGFRRNEKGIPFDTALWCYSCIGSSGEVLPVPGKQANNSHAAQRGGDGFPNAAIHTLTNAGGKMALEVDWANSLVRRRPGQQGPNQQWRFLPLGAGIIIESCRKSPDGKPLYLAVDGHAKPGASVIVS
ncbi:hypothetical protein C8Q73DRAFT_141057 [Cubamyces lactineus]|nr:hypothetical protein C8Q73DRAFT_141057 [Cubamyces lactineus]